MPTAPGRYCEHCADGDGELQSFEVRFANMVALVMRQDPSLSRALAEHRTRELMATMPAWRSHPALAGRRDR